MKTYQDLIDCGADEKKRRAFMLSVIAEHKSTEMYRTACDAEMYYRHMNPTIMKYQKYIYDVLGRRVPDVYAANHHIPSRYYFIFVTQEIQYLLGNGISFGDSATKERLGNGFDSAVQKAATMALNGGVAFGFWNADHLEVFGIADTDGAAFCPIYDEENGALRAGVRYWQIDDAKPLRITLYEEDGITEYIRRKGEELTELAPKRAYIQVVETSESGYRNIYDGGNYPSFPIVPLYNINRQSEIVGTRETIDAYDLMASALVNNVDDANVLYWIIKNAGAMDDADDERFIERLKTTHVAHLDGDQEAEPHGIEAPFAANENALARLRNQLYDDFMALDIKEIASGAVTATQIEAAYEPLNSKCDLLEYNITEFILGILKLIGIDDKPTYTRSKIINRSEEITSLLQSANYLSEEFTAKALLDVLGYQDMANIVLAQKAAEGLNRFADDIGEERVEGASE